MTVELGLAITFRFRTGPGVPLEHGPGSRGFKDLPWVALTIPKYHLATRLSLSNGTTAMQGPEVAPGQSQFGIGDVGNLGQHTPQTNAFCLVPALGGRQP